MLHVCVDLHGRETEFVRHETCCMAAWRHRYDDGTCCILCRRGDHLQYLRKCALSRFVKIINEKSVSPGYIISSSSTVMMMMSRRQHRQTTPYTLHLHTTVWTCFSLRGATSSATYVYTQGPMMLHPHSRGLFIQKTCASIPSLSRHYLYYNHYCCCLLSFGHYCISCVGYVRTRLASLAGTLT